MKKPPFEEALSDISSRMGLSPIELIKLARDLRHIIESQEAEPPDEYCEQQCILAENIENVTSSDCLSIVEEINNDKH